MAERRIRLQRLRMRSWRRGMKEMDLILGHFADQELDRLSDVDLDVYEALLAENDQDLYLWVTARLPGRDRVSDAAPVAQQGLLSRIASHAARRLGPEG